MQNKESHRGKRFFFRGSSFFLKRQVTSHAPPHPLSASCVLCGTPVPAEEPRLCTDCLRRTAEWDGFRLPLSGSCACIAAARYSDTAGTVRAFKFQGHREYARTLAWMMARAWARQGAPAAAAVSWVPVSPLRRFVRGYDQSRLLAQALGEQLGLPVYPVLRKRRHTPKQSRIADAEKRAKNVRDAYTALEPGAGRHILLTDDVVTTGATLREAAGTLERAGWRCTAICFAATPEKLKT